MKIAAPTAFVLVILAAGAGTLARTGSTPVSGAIQKPPPTPEPDPFPPPAALVERRRTAENRPLFQTSEALAFTLTADFKAVDRDRNPESTVTFPATITFPGADGTTISRPLRIRGRGHSRRAVQRTGYRTCDFTPLRLEFDKDQMKGTVFDGQGTIKLGTHCRLAALFEQFVLREYTAYRIFNLLTPISFRVRLAKATYVDAVTKRSLGEWFAMFIEDADDVARRVEGRINERRIFGFQQVDADFLTLTALFEFMIGNTDFSVRAQHNIRIAETPGGTRYAVPYDFDYAGLVDTPYAVVDTVRIIGISSVRERLYLGPCRTAAELEPFFAKMRALRPQIEALYDDQPGFTNASRRNAKSYLGGFFRTIDGHGSVKREIIDRCRSGSGI